MSPPPARSLTASEDENADLFWALRGGGGNFGVVTDFTYRLHPIPEQVLVGIQFFELADGPAVFAAFRDRIDDAPREYGGYPAMHLAPPLPFFTEDQVGNRSRDRLLLERGTEAGSGSSTGSGRWPGPRPRWSPRCPTRP